MQRFETGRHLLGGRKDRKASETQFGKRGRKGWLMQSGRRPEPVHTEPHRATFELEFYQESS